MFSSNFYSIPTIVLSMSLPMLTACSSEQVVDTLQLDHEDVFSLKVGTCFNDDSESNDDLINTIPVKSCDEPHDNEIYYTYQLTGNYPEYDSDEEAEIYEKCEEEYAHYIGIAAEQSLYDFDIITPSEDSWKANDREILCYVFNPRFEEKLPVSLAGVKQ